MNKISFLIIVLLFYLVGCTNNSNNTDWPQITTEAKPWTRWWWLGSDVDSVNLAYNLETLSQAGIGGVEITPIYGVKGRESHYIDYLSPKWMEMLDFVEAEASRLGMLVDMNTGTGWPFGGPDVTIEDAATKAIFLEYNLQGGNQLQELIVVNDNRQKEFAYLDKLIAYSSAGEKIDLTDKVNASGKLEWTAPANDDFKLVALFVGKTLQKVKRAAPGGEGYVLDHFNKQAVLRYFGKFDKAFSQNSTGYPNGFFNDSYEVYGADWTPELLTLFENIKGYKLQDFFPELLADGKTDLSKRIISDYREVVGEILKVNFTETWTDWAHSKKATTRNQAHGSPANLIDIYAAVDIPECESFGITDFDIPNLRKDSIRKKNDSDPTILKYASSAAHIAGKKYTSSETFTWLTEHFRTSLSQCKPEIDLMFVSGVNHVFFHGTTYSPKDAEWPGWKFYASVDMSPTNSIWKDASAFFRYITRVQSFLQDGKPDNDFLLYLPIYDIWDEQRGNFFTTFAIHGMRERLPKFCDGVDKIMQCGYDLDYISDHFIKTTKVENGLLKTEGGATYKALILPAADLIPVETIEHILNLVKKGATILFADQYPTDVPGYNRLEERRSAFKTVMNKFPAASFNKVETNKLKKGIVITGSNYVELLSAFDSRKEAFVTEFGGKLIRRKHSGGHHYFLTMLQNNNINGWVKLGVNAKSAIFFDPMTGNKGQASIRQQNNNTEVFLQLQPGESIILKTFDIEVKDVVEWQYIEATANKINLDKGWELRFKESEPAINESFSLENLGSWTELATENAKINMGTGRYSIVFDFEKKDGFEYILDLKDVRESAVVYVNEENAGTLFSVPFQVNISSQLKNGENKIEIDVTNLPANRIADYDKRNVEWRIFHEINFVSITYKPTKFDTWNPVPSGLLGPVSINEFKIIRP